MKHRSAEWRSSSVSEVSKFLVESHVIEIMLFLLDVFLDSQLVEQIMIKIRTTTELATKRLINGMDEAPIIDTCRRLSLHLLSQMNANDTFSAHLITNSFIQAELLMFGHPSLTNDLNALITDCIHYASPQAKRDVANNVHVFAKDAIHSCRTHYRCVQYF